MQQFHLRVESVGQTLNHRTPTIQSNCLLCNRDTTYEADVAVSVANVVGMPEWEQQWRSLMETMRTLERQLRVCVVRPPDEQFGPRFTTCQQCSVCGTSTDPNDDNERASDNDNDTPLRPFI
jgi:hypothetical protein